MLDIVSASIADIRCALLDGEITVRALVFAYIDRIMAVSQCEGGVNAVLEINPDALMIADALDAKLRAGEPLGPLFGVPVLLKDNINTADKLQTTAGSIALSGNFAPEDAHVVRRLRDADAVILGKANMTEFANFMANDMKNGYSSRGGQVLNPYNRDEDVSGSSSGSAAAVAAGLCPVSVGTETSGSILSPAWCNGVVGIKPTLGLVSRTGIAPISVTLDTAGPMARRVRDAALLLDALAGEDARDPATLAAGGRRTASYADCLDAGGLRGARIGVNRAHEDTQSADAKAAFAALLALLTEAGATLVEGVGMERAKNTLDVMQYEFQRCMDAYLAALGPAAPVRTLGDIVRFNQAHAADALRYGQSRLLEAQNAASGRLTEAAYWEAMRAREALIAALDRAFDERTLDVLLCAAPSNIAPFAGFPAVTIPVGKRKDNVPVGSYWIARRFDEATLLKIAYAAEQALGVALLPG